jgi:hypothetical protein
MSTLTATKPAQPAPQASSPARRDTPPLWARYISAMLYFMGAALIAGGVVHYPIDPPQYTVICIIGAVVFALGTVFNEFVLAPERPTVGRALWLVSVSLVLSFGVGLTGGGIQHFDQFPERCALMTPIGLAMSYVAFVAKDKEGSWRSILGPFGAFVAAVVIATLFGMSALANSIEPAGHDHDTSNQTPATEPSDHTNDEQAPAPADEEPAGHDDTGHGH